jgi:SRSO17 transposase
VAFGLEDFFSFFVPCFKSKTRQIQDKALTYLKGLFKCEKKRANCQFIADSLDEFNHQSLNHMLTDSPWEATGVFWELCRMVPGHFDQTRPVALLIDEVGNRKKGKSSACVARQYLGSIGKQDNGQVAVVAGLAQGDGYCPVYAELFMPECWEKDTERRKKAGIPDHVRHRSKPQMALDMILDLLEKGVKFDYVNYDALYGSSKSMVETLVEKGIRYVGDVKQNMLVFLEKPDFVSPETAVKTRGRKRKYPHTKNEGVKVSDYKDALKEEQWQKIAFRNGSNNPIEALFHSREVWVCTDEKTGNLCRLILLIRKDPDGKTKYSLTNMVDLDLKELAYRQGQRVFVEKIFEEGKNQVGMGDYQVRSWDGFHKHMALCFLGLCYIFYQKRKLKEKIPLTAPIIRKLVASAIKSKWDHVNSAISLAKTQLKRYWDSDLYKINNQLVI